MIDAHSHYGSRHVGTSDYSDYLQGCGAVGVTTSILMPAPSPVLNITADRARQLFKGSADIIDRLSHSDATIFEYHTFVRNNRVRPVQYFKSIRLGDLYSAPLDEDPYLLPNLQMLDQFRDDRRVRLAYFLHPRFLDYSIFDRVQKGKVVAFKLHGTAGCFTPEDIDDKLIRTFQQCNLPLIVHTDFDRNSPSYKTEFILGNMPIKWIRFALRNNLRVYLTHGVRVDEESAALVNSNPNLLVGTGPEKRLADQPDKLQTKVEGVDQYLEWLATNIDSNKLAFDFDFPWNATEGGYDWQGPERLARLINDPRRTDLVLCLNAKRFFEI